MPRALDHIVWPSRDLGNLADAFGRLGFTVGRRNMHPWGTVNHIVQFEGAFLELLGFADDYRPVPDDASAFPFAGFCEHYLRDHHAGAAMLVLRSDDAAADADALSRQGLGQGRMLPFSRGARGPDGRDRTVAFTIAFATLPGLTDIGTFLCQQHRPENFWDPAAQRHANTATGIAGLTIHGPDPQAHAAALRRFADDAWLAGKPDVRLDGGNRVEVVPAPEESAPEIIGVEFWAGSLPTLAERLDTAGFQVTATSDAVTVSSPAFGGTTLVFRPRPA